MAKGDFNRRLSSAKPFALVIMDGKKQQEEEEDDEDKQYVVEEAAPPPPDAPELDVVSERRDEWPPQTRRRRPLSVGALQASCTIFHSNLSNKKKKKDSLQLYCKVTQCKAQTLQSSTFCFCLLPQRPAEDFDSEDKHGKLPPVAFLFIPLIKSGYIAFVMEHGHDPSML